MGQRWPWRSHRGAVLFLVGLLAVLYGYAIHISNRADSLTRSSYAFDLMGIEGWANTFIVVGVIVGVGSALRFDRWFFTLAAGMWGVWTLFYLVAWIRGNAFGIPWLSAAFYGIVTALVVVCAGWEDEVPTPPRRFRARG